MGVNLDKPDRWEADFRESVKYYNEWFIEFSPRAFRESRIKASAAVHHLFCVTDDLTNISPDALTHHPEILQALRMCTAPPIARDRIMGIADTTRHLMNSMEKKARIPESYKKEDLNRQLSSISTTLRGLLDNDLFPWIEEGRPATDDEKSVATLIISDRLTRSTSDPIIRNEQERRQLDKISGFLKERGYRELTGPERHNWRELPPGTYLLRPNVKVKIPDGEEINLPLDVIVQPKEEGAEPILFEAKSAGDSTNVNKRRKEEAQKVNQLRSEYGVDIRYILFLCGYFDVNYLKYEAAERIDWVWEHRIEDLNALGL